MSVVYDAGVLIAADRNERRMWAEHRARLEAAIVPITTAPVVAQVSRSSDQVQLRRFLRGCEIAPFAADEPHDVGALLSRSELTDVVDAHVVIVAGRRHSVILTADPGDLRRLAGESTVPVRIASV